MDRFDHISSRLNFASKNILLHFRDTRTGTPATLAPWSIGSGFVRVGRGEAGKLLRSEVKDVEARVGTLWASTPKKSTVITKR